MIRRWAPWLVVLAALVTMASMRLADRRERVARTLSNVTINEPAHSEPTSSTDGGNQ